MLWLQSREPGWNGFGAMNEGKAVANQLLSKIAFLRLHKRVESLDFTATHRVRPPRKDRERLGQFVAGECFGHFSHFNRLRHSDLKVLRLLDQPSRGPSLRFLANQTR